MTSADKFFSPIKSRFANKSYPNHPGRPGQVGGSAPSEGGGGNGDIPGATTKTWQDLAHPTKTAGEIAKEVEWVDITDGTDKQIKFANDLRNNWLSDITHRETIAKVKYAARQEKIIDKLDYSRLANDAWNRRAISKGFLNKTSAKEIIDFFKDPKRQATKNDMVGKYAHIIQYPAQWKFSGTAWERVNK